MYVDDLVHMSEDMEDFVIERMEWKVKILEWKDALESKGIKVNTKKKKKKVVVSGSEGELFKNKTDPCRVCGR